jgi:hypothetical protein
MFAGACGALNDVDGEPDAGRADAALDAAGVGCDHELPKPLLATCIVPDAVHGTRAMLRPTGGIDFEMPLTVLELGIGAPPEGCFIEYPTVLGHGFSSDSLKLKEARWLRARAATGAESVVGVLAPSFEWPLAVGDEVNVAYRRTFGDFSPTTGRLGLRGSDGALLAWFSFAGSVEELEEPSEIALTEAEEQCRLHSECIPTWTQHGLSVTIEGQTVPVEYGRQSLVGDFEITHGGVDVQQPGGSTCPDAFVAWAAVGIWHTP